MYLLLEIGCYVDHLPVTLSKIYRYLRILYYFIALQFSCSLVITSFLSSFARQPIWCLYKCVASWSKAAIPWSFVPVLPCKTTFSYWMVCILLSWSLIDCSAWISEIHPSNQCGTISFKKGSFSSLRFLFGSLQ